MEKNRKASAFVLRHGCQRLHRFVLASAMLMTLLQQKKRVL